MSARKAATKEDAIKTEEKPAVPTRTAAPSAKVGDVVIYAHRPMTDEPNVPSSFPVPMVVTTTFGRVVNGVVLSDNAYLGFVGYKVVQDVEYGDGPGEWQHRS